LHRPSREEVRAPCRGPVDPQVLLSLQAAWKTALIGRTMLQVVKDERYEEYPIGRHLDFA
jgi:hypothetical protein